MLVPRRVPISLRSPPNNLLVLVVLFVDLRFLFFLGVLVVRLAFFELFFFVAGRVVLCLFLRLTRVCVFLFSFSGMICRVLGLLCGMTCFV